jgi:hypothetical protein
VPGDVCDEIRRRKTDFSTRTNGGGSSAGSGDGRTESDAGKDESDCRRSFGEAEPNFRISNLLRGSGPEAENVRKGLNVIKTF